MTVTRSRTRRDDDEEQEERRPRSLNHGRRARDDDEDRPRDERRQREDHVRARRDREEVQDRGGRSPRRTTRTKGSAHRRGGRGWNSVAQAAKERSSFPDKLKVEKQKIVVKFLESEPFDTYYVHWINELPKGWKKSWTCIAEDKTGTGCPLCTELDDSPGFRALFNVVDMTGGREPQLMIWETTADPLDRIDEAREDYGDLSDPDLYFVVSKKKSKNGFFEYKVERIKARDLEDEFDVAPLSEDELEDFTLYTDEITEAPSVEALEEVIEELEE